MTLGEAMCSSAPTGIDRVAERLPGPAEVLPMDAILLTTRGSLGGYLSRATTAMADCEPPPG